MESEDDTYTHATGLGCALDSFTESEEVFALIAALPDTCHDAASIELRLQRFETVLNCYQEQPHLLDTHLPAMLLRLLNMMLETATYKNTNKDDVKKLKENDELCHAAASMASHLLKVRKAKVANKHFPHEVHHLQPVLKLLEQQDNSSLTHWKTSHVLLYWLSMLVLIPFELTRFDGSDGNGNSLCSRLDSIIKSFLVSKNANQRAAAFLGAKFVTRPDMVRLGHLRSFVEDIDDVLKSKKDVEKCVGGLMALAAVAKVGKREELTVELINKSLSIVINVASSSSPSVLLRRLRLKTLSRLGLLLMKTKVASWRYKRGNRTLAVNLDMSSNNDKDEEKNEEVKLAKEPCEELEEDIPDSIEDVIDQLLDGLRDRTTVVRWSAAKGIGRVTNRLPLQMADEVLASVLELCVDNETDAAWHGAALTIAELGRRGLILPKRLPSVLATVSSALVYDERRGSLSVGSQIRDAACYVCWSFARAYDPNVIASFIEELSRHLIVVMIFDREVSCRRAASAAFQELVGRQGGSLKHGIDILTRADYFAVGSRYRAFVELSVYVANLDSMYAMALVHHLINVKFRHWDARIRELSALAISKLCSIDKAREVVLHDGVNKVLELALGEQDDLFALHGGVLALGYIVNGLVKGQLREDEKHGDPSTSPFFADVDRVDKIRCVSEKLSTRIALRPSGVDLLRQALTAHIDQLSLASFPIHEDPTTLELWRSVLFESLSSSNEDLQSLALSALKSFVSSYLFSKEGIVDIQQRDNLLGLLYEHCSLSEAHRRGAVLAMGNLSKAFLGSKVNDVLTKLMSCAMISKGTEKWAEGRRDSVAALTKLILNNDEFINSNDDGSSLDQVYSLLENGMNDYTVDRRGDIGAWVREACMKAFVDISLTLVDIDSQVFEGVVKNHLAFMLPMLAQQALEKIDRTRGLAGSLLAKVVFHSPPLPGVKHLDFLREVVFTHNIDLDTFSFSKEANTFPMFVKLLSVEEYRQRVVQGLVVSVGGLTESLVRHASQALFNELENMDNKGLASFFTSVLNIFEQHQHLDRVTIPLLKFLDLLLSSGHLDPILIIEKSDDEFGLKLIELIKKEIQRSSDPSKLMSSVTVFCALLHTKDDRVRRKALVQLSIFLCHRFPRVRVFTANQLFETIIGVDHVVDDDNFENLQTLLSETTWDSSVDLLRPIRNSLCQLLNIPVPAVVKKANNNQ